MAMDKREQRGSNKKQRVESTEIQVKQEIEEGGTGGGALVAVEEAAVPREELTVKIYKDNLHCPVCTLPFKPPIFQCEAGHFVCGVCHAELPRDKCYACGLEGAYRRNTTLEDVVGWHRIPCLYDEYGCRTYVTYHEAGDHQLACPWAVQVPGARLRLRRLAAGDRLPPRRRAALLARGQDKLRHCQEHRPAGVAAAAPARRIHGGGRSVPGCKEQGSARGFHGDTPQSYD